MSKCGQSEAIWRLMRRVKMFSKGMAPVLTNLCHFLAGKLNKINLISTSRKEIRNHIQLKVINNKFLLALDNNLYLYWRGSLFCPFENKTPPIQRPFLNIPHFSEVLCGTPVFPEFLVLFCFVFVGWSYAVVLRDFSSLHTQELLLAEWGPYTVLGLKPT